ncbi:MAG: error-prone DNA polymerase [Planctomycetota bacterium]|nr:error-prone DNA polymerase [Planctomycetota bacterium]
MAYCELHCKTNYSFLSGASHPDELVHRALSLGYSSLAITDENSLAGVVRAFAASRQTKLKLIIGAEIVPNDAAPVVLWAKDRAAYGQLSKLITVGRRRAPKGECWLSQADIAEYSTGLMAGVIPGIAGERSRISHLKPGHASYDWFFPTHSLLTPDKRVESIRRYKEIFAAESFLLAELFCGVDDQWRLNQLRQLSSKTRLPLVAAGDVLYHAVDRQPLHDVLTATRHHTTVDQARQLLEVNAEKHLQTIEYRRWQFADIPAAIDRGIQIASECHFRLDELRYEYPEGLAPAGKTPMQFLRELACRGAKDRYPDGVPVQIEGQIEHELKLIEELRYEAYFLTVWDLVRFARSRDILCQGRGSAANSAVCYCLGITAVNPDTTDLLFERFISRERDEPPDIDVDFEHERREEVLQYLYQKYGRDRAGLAASVITYRGRSAVRDVAKALGFSPDRVDTLAKQVDRTDQPGGLERHCETAGINPESRTGKQLCHLVTEITGFPRHLSQHVGGMVMTRGNLDEYVPIENASMDDRTVIQWDKTDLEELGMLKVDCLSLGMLSAIRKCFHLIQETDQRVYTLATVPREDPRVYDMICEADTVGVFQIESRGQMSMLPRLRPRCWYDLVIEVSIVRPGPIQGNMVHPYLRRRNGEEVAVYPNEEIKAVLERTLGVPIFQEQAMKLAVVAAGFTPGEADQLRRAMGAWRKTGIIEAFKEKLMAGMRERGLGEEFADQVFRQIRGFGEYGFPESHAASFAVLVYVSAWLKKYFPAAFCASIINSQPMGFYEPAQLIADAKNHNVVVLPIDVNHSRWDCTLEPGLEGKESSRVEAVEGRRVSNPNLRLGLRMISGLPQDVGAVIGEARKGGPFKSVVDFSNRTKLGKATIARLSQADALGSLNQDRRGSLWQALAQPVAAQEQPLFDAIPPEDSPAVNLPSLTAEEEVAEDYRATGLSLKAHPVSFYRRHLMELKVIPVSELKNQRDQQSVGIAGLVISRQRPATAKGITFVTIEDESGSANLVLKPQVWQRFDRLARESQAWLAHGTLERKKGVIHVVVNRLEDLSSRIQEVYVKSRDFR